MSNCKFVIPKIIQSDGTISPEIGVSIAGSDEFVALQDLMTAAYDGYRLIDFWAAQQEQRGVAIAMRLSQISRADLRLIKKLPLAHYQVEQALDYIAADLKASGLDYFDQYLLEWPSPNPDASVQAWKALTTAQARGWIGSIGVCNFTQETLEPLIEQTGVVPCINQIELHPYLPKVDQHDWHCSLGITTQTRLPFGRSSQVFDCPVMTAMAQRLGKSIVQIILRWHHQRGVVAIPRYVSGQLPAAGALGLHEFALGESDMKVITNLQLSEP